MLPILRAPALPQPSPPASRNVSAGDGGRRNLPPSPWTRASERGPDTRSRTADGPFLE